MFLGPHSHSRVSLDWDSVCHVSIQSIPNPLNINVHWRFYWTFYGRWILDHTHTHSRNSDLHTSAIVDNAASSKTMEVCLGYADLEALGNGIGGLHRGFILMFWRKHWTDFPRGCKIYHLTRVLKGFSSLTWSPFILGVMGDLWPDYCWLLSH